MLKISGTLFKLASIFHEHHYQCFLVGGATRDLLLGKRITDYDLATDALPEQVQAIFHRVIPTGIKHGTVTVLFKKHQFEITTFRIDGQYDDKRRPGIVTFSPSIEEDLSRRDFTINAIAYDLVNHKLYDPYQGREDLARGIIRAIGTPVNRFNEDGLRLLRACRFAAQLDFTVDKETEQAIARVCSNISFISTERIRDELIKIIQSANPVRGFELMRTTGLLQAVLPELSRCIGIKQRSLHKFDVYYHSLYSCEGADRDSLEIRTAALLHDLGKAVTLSRNEAGEPIFYQHQQVSAELSEQVLRRLKFPNNFIKKVVHLIGQHMFNYSEEWSDSAVRRFLSRVGPEHFQALISLRQADQYGLARKRVDSPHLQTLVRRVREIIALDTVLSLGDLKINGDDIMHHLGLPAGRQIGLILEFLLEAVIEDPILNEKTRLLQLAENFYQQRIKIDTG